MNQTNKYQQALKQHTIKLSDNEINEKVDRIIAEKFEENNTIEVYKTIYSCLDLTSLNSTDNRENIWKLAEKINDFEGEYNDIQNVASICIYPNLIETVKEALTSDVKISSVAAGFPSSQTFSEVKIAETALAIASGADEIDAVISLSNFFDENYQELCEEIDEIKHVIKEAKLKIILETGALKSAENIAKASVLALYSGADFLKTSTGKGYEGATYHAAYVMCMMIKEYEKKNGKKVGFKASGGISNADEAVKYYTIVKEVLGTEYLNKDYFRIGASRLADDLLQKINK